VVISPVHIDKIEDIAGTRPVDEVPDSPSQNERETDASQPLLRGELGRIHADADERHNRHPDEQWRLERKVDPVQYAERCAGIADMRQIEEPRHDPGACVKREGGAHKHLGELIDQHDKPGKPQIPNPGSQWEHWHLGYRDGMLMS